MTDSPESQPRRSGWKGRAIQTLIVLIVLGAIFVGLIPQLVDYRGVWESLGNLTATELVLLLGLTLLYFLAIWLLYVAGLPSLRIRESAVAHQASTAVAYTVPAGGPVAVGVTGAMFRSWGFSYYAISRVLVVVGIWDQLARLAVPVAGAALVALTDGLSSFLLVAVLLGILFVVAAVVVLVLLFRSDGPAIWAGRVGGRIVSWAARPLGRGPFDWSSAAVALRRQTVGLTSVRWPWLTASAVGAQILLAVLLFACLRAVGVDTGAVGFLEVVGAYSLARVITLPGYTPGGVGVVELVFITLLSEAAPGISEELIAAGVFLWRSLTYLLPILGGLVSWIVWRTMTSWRRDAQYQSRGDLYAGPGGTD